MAQSLTWIYLRHLLVMLACIGLIAVCGYQLYARPGIMPVQTYTQGTATASKLTSGPVSGVSDDSRFGYLLLAGVATLVLIVTEILLCRRIVYGVRHDIKSLGRLFKDVRNGKVRVDYPMMLAEFSDIFRYLRDSGTKMVEKQKHFRKMGLLDHLSQINNRRHFEERLAELFALAKTNGPSSVLIIDLDHFKSVNDRHGHDAGDALIVSFSAALKNVVRKTDFVARLGGDEFCIIYSYTKLEQAKMLIERLRHELPREIPLTRDVVHPLRWTGGLSVISDTDVKFDDVLWRADQALLEAKQAGRNLSRVYDPSVGLLKKNKNLAG
ncbi:MAG: GGDEF domain-containing protein [Acidiferrobacterales bacterium]